jgi:DNA-directed RNA polymerase subunit N (RpoN/RPB10)
MESGSKFAHLLLFRCPECGEPIATACASYFANLEEVDARQFSAHCSDCDKAFDMLGIQAVRHWVDPWDSDSDRPDE